MTSAEVAYLTMHIERSEKQYRKREKKMFDSLKKMFEKNAKTISLKQ